MNTLDFILKAFSFLIFILMLNIYFFRFQKITRIILQEGRPLFISNLLNFAQPFRYSSSPHTPQIPTRIPQIPFLYPPFHPILTVLHCVSTPNLAVLAALKGYSPSPSYIKWYWHPLLSSKTPNSTPILPISLIQ